MEKSLFQTDSKRFRYRLTLGCLLSLQETAVFGIGDQFVFVGVGFFDIKLGNRHGGDFGQGPGILALAEFLKSALFAVDLCRGLFRQIGQFPPAIHNGIELLLYHRVEYQQLPFFVSLVFIFLSKQRGNVFFITRLGSKGFIRYAALQFLASGKTDDGVTAFDMVVEKVERFAGIVRFQPQRDLAQFHGQGVQVHAVNALTDYIADGGTKGGG